MITTPLTSLGSGNASPATTSTTRTSSGAKSIPAAIHSSKSPSRSRTVGSALPVFTITSGDPLIARL